MFGAVFLDVLPNRGKGLRVQVLLPRQGQTPYLADNSHARVCIDGLPASKEVGTSGKWDLNSLTDVIGCHQQGSIKHVAFLLQILPVGAISNPIDCQSAALQAGR